MENAIDKAINRYAKEQGSSSHRYQEFIDKLNLPADNVYLKRVISTIAADINDAESKFSWFNDTQSFDGLKQHISELEIILKKFDSNNIPVKLKFGRFPLGALLLFNRNELFGVYHDIFIILRLYCITLCLSQEGGKLSSALRIATDLRVIFDSLKGRNALSSDLYKDKALFVARIFKAKSRLNEIQSNFLDWIKNDSFSSTTKNRSVFVIPSINENQKNEQSRSKADVKPARKHSFKLDVTEPAALQDASVAVSVSISDEKNTELDEGLDLDETIEVTASEDHPLSHDGLQSVALTGSRLLVYERLHLNFRASVLDEVERKHFIEQISVALVHNEIPIRVAAIELLLMFLLSKNADSLEKLIISVAGDQFADINLSAKTWRRLSVKMPSAISPPASHFLHPHTDYCELPLPESLIAAIRSVMTTEKCSFVMIKQQAKTTNDDTLALVRRIFSTFPRRYTQQQIRATLFDFIAKRHDPGYAALLLANTEYCVPTPLYYKSMSYETLANSYRDILVELGFNTAQVNSLPKGFIGSELALDDDALAKMFSEMYQHLSQLRRSALTNEHCSLDYYNQLSCFGVVVMLVCTGHRTREEFQFEPAHIDFETGLLLLADKICFDEAAVRLVPLPQLALKMMEIFAKSSRRLADNLSSPSLAVHLRHKSFYRDVLDEPFFTYFSGESFRPVSAKHVKTFLENFGFDLPLNALRHRLCSRLSSVDAHDYSHWFLGHISEGEHPLNILSAMSLNDIAEAQQLLEATLAPLQIQLPDELETRGLKSIKTSVSGPTYFPTYLTPEYMTGRQRVKWCREKYQSFYSESIYNSEDIFEKVQVAIAELTSVIERTSCQKILVRMHEKYLQNQKLPNFQQWRGLVSERLVVLPTDLFAKQKSIMHVINALQQNLYDLVRTREQVGLHHIVLSLVINSARVYESISFIKTLQRELYVLPDMVFFQYRDLTKFKLQICDPMTVVLITHASPEWKTARFNEAQFFKMVQRFLTVKGVHSEIYKLSFLEFCEEIATYYVDPDEPSCVRAYRLGEFATSPMSLQAIVRMFTPDVIPVAPVFDKPAVKVSTKIRSVAQNPDLKKESQFFATFLTRVREKFSRLNKIDTKFKQVIPEMWQELVGARTDDLIEASEGLSDIAVAVLIFMCDVGKRPGVGRPNISYRTVETYFSKICQPLIDALGEQPFFDYDSDEILEIYQSIFDNRTLKTEARHLAILKDFHTVVSKSVYLPDMDWNELGIGSRQTDFRVSELCSDRDYQIAAELLANDPYASSNERIIQHSILILAARFGLRRREILYMLRVDLDLQNDLIAVLTNQYYRVKTPAGNRRIPLDLLINENERAVLNSLRDISEKVDLVPRSRLFPVADKLLLTRVNRVLEALKIATKNPHFRLYDCRHTFISQLVLAGLVRDTGKLLAVSSTWLRGPTQIFRRRWLSRMAGDTANKNKLLHTIALVSGHTTARTTLKHYSHVLEWVTYEYQMARLYQKFDLIELLKLVELNKYSARKFLDRSQNTLAFSTIEKLISKTDALPKLVTYNRETSFLSENKKLNFNDFFDACHDTIHSLRKITVGKTEHDLDFVNYLLQSELFLNFPFASFVNNNIRVTENKRFKSKILKALNNRMLLDLINGFAKYPNNFNDLFMMLKPNFTGGGYLYDSISLPKIIAAARKCDIEAKARGEIEAQIGSRLIRYGNLVTFEINHKNIDFELWVLVLVIDIIDNI